MNKQSIIALKFLFAMTIITGILYPLVMTGIAQVTSPYKSNGSLIIKDNKLIGSELIGQKFDSAIYFWSRPSATGYNAVPSGASNLGPTSDSLKKLIISRRENFAKANSINDPLSIPKEMISASASSLDPDISPTAALMQVNRISDARHFDAAGKEKLRKLIKDMTQKPQFHFLGRERINVLGLNLELDKINESQTIK